MQSSKLTLVTDKMKQIEKVNGDLKYLSRCVAIHFADTQEQRRISLGAETANGVLLAQLLKKKLEDDKLVLINDLAEYGVSYDGE